MPRVTRRRFLQVSGAAQTGGIGGLLATGRAPAYMYAKAIQGMAPEEAVKWAHGELTKIYA
jgi:hypothetical protein